MHGTERKIAVARFSVISNSTLVVGKLAVGLAIGSVSVISEAIHSGIDLIAAVIALLAVKEAARPPDKRHPYGHGKIENISGTAEAILIVVAAAWIMFEAVQRVMTRREIENAWLGAAIMAVSAKANFFVSKRLFKVARETDSVALSADAWHLRTDVWTSAGVLAGLGVIEIGQRLFPGAQLWWIDPVAAICVALLILKTAWVLTRHAMGDMLDESLPEDQVEWLVREIRSCTGVMGVHDIRTRKSGAQRFIEFHMLVDPAMPTAESHRLTDEVTDRILRRFPDASVTPHVEPYDTHAADEDSAAARLD
jgi:cation diffusion facilitator family transporter